MKKNQVNKVTASQRDLLMRLAGSKSKYVEPGEYVNGYKVYRLDGRQIHGSTVKSMIRDGYLKYNDNGNLIADPKEIKTNILSCGEKVAIRSLKNTLESMQEKGLWIKLEGDTFTIFRVSRGAAIAVTDIKAERVLDCNLETNIVPEGIE